MKRNLNENSTRSTAGCLPVPLFNQRKRTRQPLTSNPLQSDSGISTAADSYDFPPLPADWAWEAANPELAPLMKTRSTSQTPHSVSHPPRSQESVSKLVQPDTDRGQSGWSYRGGNQTASLQTWDESDTTSQCKRTNPMANDGNNFCPVNLGAQRQKQFKMSERPNLPRHRETQELRQMHSSKLPGSTVKGLGENSASQAFKPNLQQNQFKKKMLDDIPEKSTPKEASFQLHVKEKSNTLRIVSAVIESMKYWREHVQKTVLLFEVLAVLDSAVTPGPHYSKTFLLRDGKHTVPCVFYEIDRELPRLIRGRVHRCVGNYDQKKNIFKCVSVRPASVSEQKTFQTFVKIADAEMRYYTEVMNEV